MKKYAGIVSRKTPSNVLITMEKIGQYLSEKDFILRSGGAIGADSAFEKYVPYDKKQIFLANENISEEAFLLARNLHPAPHLIDKKPNAEYIWKLMARNCYQILGKKLNDPVDFVICWTPDGCETKEQRNIKTGGTGQAIELACLHGIEVINMANSNWRERFIKIINL